jgi:hypothetical protein
MGWVTTLSAVQIAYITSMVLQGGLPISWQLEEALFDTG